MNRALRNTLVTLLVLVALPFVVLYGLYFKGARDISPHWRATTATYPEAARVALWRWHGGEGSPATDPMSPPEFAWRWRSEATQLMDRQQPRDAGLAIAYRVARSAEMAGPPDGEGSYHLMQTAATIQASRWPANSQLDTVLEHMHFGDDTRGLRAGALRFYGEPVESLDTGKLWVLLVIAHGPAFFDPWCHRERLRKRAVERAAQRKPGLAPAAIDAALDSLVPMPDGHPCPFR